MRFLLAVVFILFASGGAIAQSDTLRRNAKDHPGSENKKSGNTSEESSLSDTLILKEIEVLGFRPDISSRTPNPVQVLTLKKLNAMPAAGIAEAIRSFAGVVVKDYGGIGGLKTVMIRSLGANHTAVFIDGLPQTDASTGQTDLGRIPVQNTGNIELSTGQASFDLKPARMYASASVMNISSLEYDFQKQSGYTSLYIKGGSFGTLNPVISYDKKMSERINSGIRLNYYNSNGRYPYNYQNGLITDKLERTNSDIESFDAYLRSDFRFRDSSSIRLKASWYKSERGLPGAVILYNPHSSQRLLNRDFAAGMQYTNNIRRRFRELLTAGISNSHLLYTDPDFLNQSGGLRNEYDQQEYYVSNALSYRILQKLNVSLSTDLIYNTLSTNAYSIDAPSRISSLTAFSAKSKFKRTEVEGSILMTAASDRTEETAGTEYFKLSPAFAVIHSLLSDQSLKARFMYKSTYRMPTFNDLYYTISGNNDLMPEDASLFNLGILLNRNIGKSTTLNFRTDGFINVVKNKINTVPTRNLFIWSTQNIGKAEITGIEIAGGIARAFGTDITIDISGTYTYQNARNVANKNDANYGNQLTYIPYETAGIICIAYYRLYSLGVNYLYNGYRYTTAANDHSSILPSWNTTDITLARKWMFKENKFEIKFEIPNLFNAQYEVVKGFPMTGRAFFISVSAII